MEATRRLWRYNYAVLMGGGYWVLIMPVAACTIVMWWMMALAAEFNDGTATYIAEIMTPILGAFLVAHSLAPEYRSRIGAVLACKPVSLHRVVTIRAGLAMFAAFLLSSLTLFLCSLLLKPVNIWTPLIVCIPSLWYLSLLALVMATLFRSALGGFLVAAAVWALDVTVGYGVNPFFSLQGWHAASDQEDMAGLWWLGKLALIAGGAFLLWLHNRQVTRVCRPADRRDLWRAGGIALLLVLAYVYSGALTTVTYGYLHRARLPQADTLWLRKQIAVYGPLPVERLFGPAFTAYVAPLPQSKEGASSREMHRERLRQAAARWPGSIWADGMHFAIAADAEQISAQDAVRDYFVVADRHDTSPFAPRALSRIILMQSPEIPPEVGLRAARRLIAEHPTSREAEIGALLMRERLPAEVRPAEMEKAALVAAGSGVRYRQPAWLVLAAQMQREQGREAEARATARRARDEAQVLLREVEREGPRGGLQRFRAIIDAAVDDANDLLNGSPPAAPLRPSPSRRQSPP